MGFENELILLLYLLAVLGIGWFCRHNSSDQDHHYLAGRSMGAFPIGLSIMVTSFSGINYIAIPEEVSCYGLYVVLSFPVFFLAAWCVSRWWLPYFQRLHVTTVYEFLENRFSRRVRLLASGLFLCWRFLWMGVALYVSGRILSVFTGYSATGLLLLCGIIAVLYTSIGGMRAVMWTDVLQFIVLFFGIVFCVVYVIGQMPAGTMKNVVAGGRLQPYFPVDVRYFSLNPFLRMTFFSVILGTAVAFMTRYGADQVVMQRYFTARTLSQARRGIWLNAIFSFLALSCLACLGLALYASAAGHAVSGKGFALKQLVALSRHFPPGCPGFLVAGILAATMSSIDSGINACSASLSVDFRIHLSARLQTFVCGGVMLFLALFLLPFLHQHQTIFAIVSRFVNGLGAPLLVLVALGMFGENRFREETVFWGGCAGISASLTVTSLISNLSLHYYAVVNFLMTAVCIIIIHLWSKTWRLLPMSRKKS